MPDSQFWRRLRRPSPKASQENNFQAGQTLAPLLDEAGRKEVAGLAAQGEHIRAIKRIRELTGLSLRESRKAYDSAWR